MTKAIRYKIQQHLYPSIRDRVEEGEEEGESDHAYLKMNYVQYCVLTLVLYMGSVVGAVVSKDIGVIFEYIGAFGFSCFSFVFPGIFYILLMRKHATQEQKEKDGKLYLVGAYIMVGLGVANMILVIVKSAAGPAEVDPD